MCISASKEGEYPSVKTELGGDECTGLIVAMHSHLLGAMGNFSA